MFINSNKTKCMIIGTRQNIWSQEHEPCLTICSEKLQNSSCEQLLGIKVDPQLNWACQVDAVCSKILSRIYLLSKIKKFLNIESKKLLYNGHIPPLIDYCCIVWGSCNNEGLNRILKLPKKKRKKKKEQKESCTTYNGCSSLITIITFISIYWLNMKIVERIKYHKYILTLKCIKQEATSYLNNKLSYVSEISKKCYKWKYECPQTKDRNIQTIIICIFSPFLWNCLPTSVRKSNNTLLKTNIKNYIFDSSNHQGSVWLIILLIDKSFSIIFLWHMIYFSSMLFC